MFSEKSGVLIAPKDGVYLPVLDITHKVTAGDSDGSVVIDEWTLAPGGLIPPHTHTREDECSYVLQGELTCYVGEVPHAFYNAGAGAVRVMEILTPGQSFEGYFDEYEPLASRGTSDDEHNRMRAELGKSYGITWHDDLVPEVEASFGICG